MKIPFVIHSITILLNSMQKVKNNLLSSQILEKVSKKAKILVGLLSFFLFLGLYSCSNESESPDVSAVKVNVTIERLDESVMNLKSRDEVKAFLSKNVGLLRQFYGSSAEDSILIDWLTVLSFDEESRKFYERVKQHYGDLSDLKSQFETAFKHLKFYYPDFKEPRIITTFTGFSHDISVSDTLVIIGLESFLGPKFAERPRQPNYILRRYDKPYIVPTVVALLSKKYNKVDVNDRTMLADMMYYGKSFEFMKAMLPETADSLIIGYPDSSMVNTAYAQDLVWGHFIDKQLIYETNDRIKDRYLVERPKTTEIGPACPGRIGQWVGWEIVKHYRTENPKITLQQLMANQNARQIFEESKYKGQAEN